jgi:hypothetical protein
MAAFVDAGPKARWKLTNQGKSAERKRLVHGTLYAAAMKVRRLKCVVPEAAKPLSGTVHDLRTIPDISHGEIPG